MNRGRELKNAVLAFVVLYLSSFVVFAAEKMDYDGESGAEIMLRTPSNFRFTDFSNNSVRQFGRSSGDIPVAGDFDGDGIFDLAVRRPSNGTWYVLNSSGSNYNSANYDSVQRQSFASQATDIPTVGDFDGDGIHDFAVRRPSNQTWYIRNSSGTNYNSSNNDGVQRIRFGLQDADIPVPADYNGDGITDIAVRRPSNSTWYIRNSEGSKANYNSPQQDGIQRVKFGTQAQDIPVPADYDGDGIDDIAVRRPSTFYWYILNSGSGEITRHVFGRHIDDIPMVADYDADGKADIAVRRPGNQHVYILRSSDNQIERHKIGGSEDIPVAAPPQLIMTLVRNNTANLDSDSDGLTDLEETEVYGTNPLLADSDGDGLSDYDEIKVYRTDPNNQDTDADGIPDAEEVANGTNPNLAGASNFDLQTLTDSPNYMLFDEADVHEGYLTQSVDVFMFSEDGELTVEHSTLAGPRRSTSFQWQINDNGNIERTEHPVYTRNGYDVYPYENIESKWGLEVAASLRSAHEAGEISYDIRYTENRQDSDDTYNFVLPLDKGYKVQRRWTNTEILNLPNYPSSEFLGENAPQIVNSYSRNFDLITHIDSQFSSDPSFFEGQWALPLYHELERESYAYETGENFRTDMVSFESDTVSRTYFDDTYQWTLSDDGVLSVFNDTQQLRYWAQQRLENEYLVFVEYSVDGEVQAHYVGLMVKVSGNASEFLDNVTTDLPYTWASMINAWWLERHDGDRLSPDELYSFHFQSNGYSRSGLLPRYNDDGQPRDIFLGHRGSWQYSENDDGKFGLSFWSHEGSQSILRGWTVLDVNSDGKVVVFEFAYRTNSSNELIYHLEPRINYLERVDFSDYPEFWNHMDLDNDGLSNGEEASNGTDISNPDTDGDGISDYDEVTQYGTDPTSTDSDGDGLSDSDEILLLGTDPTQATNGHFTQEDVAGFSALLMPEAESLQDGFVVPNADIYEFGDDSQLNFHESKYFGGSQSHELQWQVNDNGLLQITGYGLAQDYYYDSFPYDGVRERYGDKVAGKLVDAYIAGVIDGNIYFERQRGPYRQILSRNSDASDASIRRTLTVIDRIILPQDIVDYFGDDLEISATPETITISNTLDQLTFAEVNDALQVANFSNVDFSNDWVLPMYFALDRDTTQNSGQQSFQWDFVQFTDDRASTFLSKATFEWQVNAGALELTNTVTGDTLTYRMIQSHENEYSLLVSFQEENGPLFYFAGHGARVDSGEQSFYDNLMTDLPEVYSSVISGYLSQNYNDGLFDQDRIFAYQFYSESELNRGIVVLENGEGEKELFPGEVWDYATQPDEKTLVMQTKDARRIRTWHILGTDSNNKTLVLEYSLIAYDTNRNGTYEDEEYLYLIQPRINMMAKLDLSEYGDLWQNADFDLDGLTNAEEMELGTDPGNDDTDGDGFKDGWEVSNGLDPLVADPLVDLSIVTDEGLRNCITRSYEFHHYSPPEENSVNRYKTLRCGNHRISDLSGIEQFASLESLNLNSNSVADISALANLTQLHTLHLGANPVTDISVLANLTNLTYLALWRTQISDFSVLATLTQLEILLLNETSFSDTQLLSGLVNLTGLYLTETLVTDLSGLAPLIKLRDLFIDKNPGISDVSALYGMSELVGLDMSRTSVTDIDIFLRHDNWQSIGIDGIPVTLSDLQFLANQTQLVNFYAEEVGVSDLIAVVALIQDAPIRNLWFGKNQVSDVSALSELKDLGRVDLNTSAFTDISVFFELPILQAVYLNDNPQINCDDYSALRFRIFVEYNECKSD